MKLFDFFTQWDYGREIYFTLGQFEKFNILDLQLHSSDYWSWEPNIRLTASIFDGTVFSFSFYILCYSMSLDFISYRCPFNRSQIR